MHTCREAVGARRGGVICALEDSKDVGGRIHRIDDYCRCGLAQPCEFILFTCCGRLYMEQFWHGMPEMARNVIRTELGKQNGCVARHAA